MLTGWSLLRSFHVPSCAACDAPAMLAVVAYNHCPTTLHERQATPFLCTHSEVAVSTVLGVHVSCCQCSGFCSGPLCCTWNQVFIRVRVSGCVCLSSENQGCRKAEQQKTTTLHSSRANHRKLVLVERNAHRSKYRSNERMTRFLCAFFPRYVKRSNITRQLVREAK
jgi:hypothetical protein